MTEKDYILARDLGRIRVALDALRDIISNRGDDLSCIVQDLEEIDAALIKDIGALDD